MNAAPPPSDALAASYDACQRLTRRTAKNFYYSFLLLPRGKLRAMCALYAFLRRTDDLADNEAPVDDRRRDLAAWRVALDQALAGSTADPMLPALADTVQTFAIPSEYLLAAIEGVEMDLEPRGFDTFADLAGYCHKVASVVGLACIHIWGFHDRRAIEPACQCGIAFQLTNILRDLKEDAQQGRIYLPREDFVRFGYSVDDLKQGRRDARFEAFMEFQIARAEQHYQRAAELFDYLEPDGRAAFGAMVDIYRGLLDEIKRRRGDVFSQRVGLSLWQKLGITARWYLPWPLVRTALEAVGARRG